jgi:hypothetical protein
MKTFLLLGLMATLAQGAQPEVAEFSFDGRWADLQTAEGVTLPSWVTGVRQEGGVFLDDPRCWRVEAGTAKGVGKLEIAVDRTLIASGNLVATLLFDAGDLADVAVQLFDAQGQVVVVDLFGNLVDIGKEATTDTFVIPLGKYPSAERIVIRHLQGGLSLHGLVLYPVVTEGPMEEAALRELARVLGDPLSAANPLVTSLQKIAKDSGVEVQPVKVAEKKAAELAQPYPAAVPFVGQAPAPATGGLIVHLNFDQNEASNAAKPGGVLQVNAEASFVNSDRGPVMRLRKKEGQKPGTRWDSLSLPVGLVPPMSKELSLCDWVRFQSITRNGGSQIVWVGDRRPGRDPWVLNLLPDGWLQFRSDLSVTGRPQFAVFKNELMVTPAGKAHMVQHVAVRSPQRLAKDQWYFVAATMGQLNDRTRIMTLYVNGQTVGDVQTREVVDYNTEKMWATVGSVHHGEGQNFDGEIDDVRIYDRALTAAEILGLYQQPWQ